MRREIRDIHNALCDAIVANAFNSDLTSKEVSDYLQSAVKGMDINSAFAVNGLELAKTIKNEKI